METISFIIIAIIAIIIFIANLKWFASMFFVAIGGSFVFSGFGVLVAFSNVTMIPDAPFTSILVTWLFHLILTVISGLLCGFLTTRDLGIEKLVSKI